MTYLEAIDFVQKNEGKEYDYSIYCLATDWDIQELVEYLDGLERCDEGDYPFVIDDIEAHIDSCGFTKSEYDEVIEALGLQDHLQICDAC